MNGHVRIGRADDIPMLEGRTVNLGMRRVAVFRTADGFHALAGACPHRGGPLADGPHTLAARAAQACPRQLPARPGVVRVQPLHRRRYAVGLLDAQFRRAPEHRRPFRLRR